MTDNLADLSAIGVSVWLDDLDRGRLSSGGLQELIDTSHVVGVTTNPSIFDNSISHGSAEYAAQIADLGIRGVDVGEAVRSLTAFDVRWACDVMRPVYDATGGSDGRCQSRLIHAWPMTQQPPSPRRRRCGGPSIGPTCW